LEFLRKTIPLATGLLGLLLANSVSAQTLPSFDFTNTADAAGWVATHHLGSLATTTTGLLAQISGLDPYLTGPSRDYPAGLPLWLRLKLFSEAGGSCQVFYFSNIATEAASVRFSVPGSQWTEGRVGLPALGPGYRVRVDPPGTNGSVTLAHLRFEPRGEFPDFDLSTVPDATAWAAQHDIASLTPATNGLVIDISGNDPYMAGPARDYPAGKLLWLHVRLKSDQAGTAQMFYYQSAPAESNSVRFYVPAGVWHEAIVPMSALGESWRLRFDPPGGSGSCTLGRIWFEERVLYPPPAWPVPTLPVITANAFRLASGDLEIAHNRDAHGAFRLRFAGQPVAAGNPDALLGYVSGTQTKWMTLGNSPTRIVTSQALTNGFLVCHESTDGDGARWRVEQRFAANAPNAIEVETRISTDRDRQVLYVPAFTLLAGADSHGTNKTQGLLAGLEYLENEPSSSELDIIGTGARRLVPDAKKLTFPLMAIAASNHCLGLIWEPQPCLAPVFDSPDRQFKSGGHLLGLLYPGSDGLNRDEGSLLPYSARLLRANEALITRCTIIASHGDTVAPAVQQYIAIHGLPPLPGGALTASNYFRNAAAGWLDSAIRTNNLIRHAVWPGFGAQPAADAAVWMRWLAEKVNDAPLTAALSNTAGAVLAQVPSPSLYNNYAVGHVRYPLPALIFGSVLPNATQARTDAVNLLGRFQPDGTVLYVPPSGGTDLGATHYAPDANGLTANVVASLLNEALFCGDRSMIGAAIDKLRAMDKFRNTVPRGAQTWEVPLHTPDILASAYLVMAYVQGYQATGDGDLLEQARYWAWTGVPFVYLAPPVPEAVGLYGTIPVLGATHWVGSWFGRPVQWCGLVYGEALYQLALVDPAGPWKQIADGIAASGTQQVWPLSDPARQGLLPDFYLLQQQVSDGPAINPGTLQSQAVQLYTGARPYTFCSLREHGLLVHAPGAVGEVTQSLNSVAFTITNWASAPTWVLIGGLNGAPGVSLNGAITPIVAPHQYDVARRLLVLRVEGTSRIQLLHPALPQLDIKTSISNGSVELSWPAANSNFVLQQTVTLPSPGSWSNSVTPVSVKAGRRVVTEPAGSTARFFRLQSAP
jgi:hypothetical protein